MEKLIACCGYNCATCDARIATVTNDNELRAKKAEEWKIQYNTADISPEMINCTECRGDGVIIGHCQHCEIRNCVRSKGFQTCADCNEMEICQTLEKVLRYVPDALENLKSLN
jgi:hypothetical protein